MKLFLTILLMLFFALASCSNLNKKNSHSKNLQKKEVKESYSELGDDDDFLDSDDLDNQEDIDEDIAGNVLSEDMDGFGGTNRVVASYTSGPGDTASYNIQKNDTLMIISFKVYGDYSRWQEIQEMNPEINAGGLVIGNSITLKKPDQEFVWTPKGTPYIVQKGDTLGSISNDKHGTTKRWREIYENNRPLIKDPNLIFTGFTLYYNSGENEFAYNLY